MMPPKKLTAKQQRFVEEYLIDLNATQAAIRAGYSSRTAKSVGSENLSKPDVAAAIRAGQAKRSKAAAWTAVERMKSLQAIHDAQLEKDPRTAIAAIQEANKMDGSHAPSQHRHAGPNGGPIPVVDLSKATDEQLDALEALFGPLAVSGGDDEGDTAGEGEEGR